MEDEESPMDEKGHKMIEVLSKLDLGESAAIIFVRRRKDCHRISEFLNDAATNKDLKIENLNSLQRGQNKDSYIKFIDNVVIVQFLCHCRV